MKILYLCCDSGIPVLGYKGASIHVRELISAFRRAGHEVILAAQLLNKNPWETPASLNARVIQVRPSSASLASVSAVKEFQEIIGMEASLASELRRLLFNKEIISELKRQCDSARPDFIYERASLYGIAGVQLAREFKVPLLVELNAPLALEHTTYRADGLHDMGALAERWALAQADAVLAVSTQLRKHVIDLGVAAERVHILPNGVDPSLFYPAPPEVGGRARLGLSPGPVIGFVGGLRPWHGVEVLPELLQKLARRHSRIQMVIVGEGPLRASLTNEFERRQLSARVRFTGSVPHEQIPAIIRHFDIALAPYPRLNHQFYFSPLKLYEYMACGIPVVASAAGQISEVIKNGKNGLLCPPQQMSALTAACDRLLGDESLRHRLGRAGCKLVHTHFTWDHNARRITDLVAALAQGKRIAASTSGREKVLSHKKPTSSRLRSPKRTPS
jgi:glycosyltransferase involved in cell wall biosynthesis